MNCFRNTVCLVIITLSYSEDEVIPFSSVYYDPATKQPLRLTSVENVLSHNLQYATKSNIKVPQKMVRRIGFRSNGCTCQGYLCGCCLGINLNQFNFQREGCMNFTYDPDGFAINMNVYMNNNNVFSNSFSGSNFHIKSHFTSKTPYFDNLTPHNTWLKQNLSLAAQNPPPICIPVPIPYIPIAVDACVRLFNIYTPGQNLHMCVDFETKIQKANVLVLHFDCIRMGADGVALLKPEDGGGLPNRPTVIDNEQTDIDIYDEVTEIKYVNKTN